MYYGIHRNLLGKKLLRCQGNALKKGFICSLSHLRRAVALGQNRDDFKVSSIAPALFDCQTGLVKVTHQVEGVLVI
jgi:hypothetical protein